MAVNTVANISGTYGYYLSELKRNALDSISLLPVQFSAGNIQNNNRVIQGFAEDIAKRYYGRFVLHGSTIYKTSICSKLSYIRNYCTRRLSGSPGEKRFKRLVGSTF